MADELTIDDLIRALNEASPANREVIANILGVHSFGAQQSLTSIDQKQRINTRYLVDGVEVTQDSAGTSVGLNGGKGQFDIINFQGAPTASIDSASNGRQLNVTVGGGGLCYDYIVDASMGAHVAGSNIYPTLFGTGGALAAAFAVVPFPNDYMCAIWVCPGHEENVTQTFSPAAPFNPFFDNLIIESTPLEISESFRTTATFILDTSQASFFNRPSFANFVSSLVLRNLTFLVNDSGKSVFTGTSPWANSNLFENCQFQFVDHVFNVDLMNSDRRTIFENCQIVSTSIDATASIIQQNTVTGTSGVIPLEYQSGIYFRRCSIEGYGSLFGGTGVSNKAALLVSIDDCAILLLSQDLVWLDLRQGGLWADATVGGGSFVRSPRLLFTRNRITSDGPTSTSKQPFIKATASATFELDSILIQGNNFRAENDGGSPVTDDSAVLFADIGGVGGPTNVSITDNTISLVATTPAGRIPHCIAIQLGAATVNARVDNVYKGFATNLSDLSGNASGASGPVVLYPPGTPPPPTPPGSPGYPANAAEPFVVYSPTAGLSQARQYVSAVAAAPNAGDIRPAGGTWFDTAAGNLWVTPDGAGTWRAPIKLRVYTSLGEDPQGTFAI